MHSYWAHALQGPRALEPVPAQQEKPLQWETRTETKSSPHSPQLRKLAQNAAKTQRGQEQESHN